MRINIDKLEQLYQHASQPQRKLIHKRFCFSVFNSADFQKTASGIPKCGTVGCLLGELPAIEPRVRFSGAHGIMAFLLDGYESNARFIASEIFGLNSPEVWHIFYPKFQDPASYGGVRLYASSTKSQVLSNLRIFIDKCKSGEIV